MEPTIGEIEEAIRLARFSETPVDQMARIQSKTRAEALQHRGEMRDAFWAGYQRGRKDHMAGAFSHAAAYVWASGMAGMLFGFFAGGFL